MTPRASATALPGVLLLEWHGFVDQRGAFHEVLHDDWHALLPPDTRFVRSAVSHNTRRHTLRGLHYQLAPHAEGKLVQVVHGAVLDVAVDLRADSPAYGTHVALELRGDRCEALWIPPGCAHGFCTLEAHTSVLYHLTRDYAPDHQGGIRWDDPSLGIAWPPGAHEAVISDRDRRLPLLRRT